MNIPISSHKKNESLPKAVILGLYYTGYGVIRELSPYDIPLCAFDEELRWPERVTRLAKRMVVHSEQDLLTKLTQFSEKEQKKPVLFLTSDTYVEYYLRYRDVLKDYYSIDFPESDVADLLLKKGRFAQFASLHGYNIPSTWIMRTAEDYARISGEITFPCVVKPFWRSITWLSAKLKKVYRYTTKAELEKGLEYLTRYETNLIIQQYISGGDREVYFHLMYYNNESKCIGEFTGRKLRQWPVGIGQTSCAEAAPWATEVRDESRRLFDQMKYRGFGSVEFKRDSSQGKYYIMEPTVGRQNAQSFLAAINGVPMSLIGYSALTGNLMPRGTRRVQKTFWIDDQYDLFSIAVSGKRGCLHIRDVIRSYWGRKKLRLFNSQDIQVFLYCWTIVLLSKLLGKIRRKFLA